MFVVVDHLLPLFFYESYQRNLPQYQDFVAHKRKTFPILDFISCPSMSIDKRKKFHALNFSHLVEHQIKELSD